MSSTLIVDPVDERHIGILRSGKEAQIDIVEYIDEIGATSLIARKRYLPRTVSTKGQLEMLGVQRASAFRHDVEYREGRQFRKSRDRRAVEQMSAYGRHLLSDRWLNHEHDVMRVLWDAGCAVPYPISYVDDRFDMEYLGTLEAAAPQLARARLGGDELRAAWDQLLEGLAAMTAAGWAHGDLSSYNTLWWQDRLWFIDFPQAVDIAANPNGLEFLHRDVTNICEWFARRGIVEDPEEVFADLLAHWG